jgi:hypothetical protein
LATGKYNANDPLLLTTQQSCLTQKPVLDGSLYPTHIQKAKDFWKSMNSSPPFTDPLSTLSADVTKSRQQSSPRLTRVTSVLEDDQEHVPRTQPLTVKGGKEHEYGEDVQQDKFVDGFEDEVSDPEENSVGKKLLSMLQDVQDCQKAEEQVSDKENAPAGLSGLKPFVARPPSFILKDNNDPITRRHTDSSQNTKTSEPLKDANPTSKSVEATKTVDEWFLTKEKPSDENSHRPPFAERRSSRNLLGDFQSSIPTRTADASQEIVRKRGNFEFNRKLFEEGAPNETTAKEAASDHSTSQDRSGSDAKDTASNKPPSGLLSRQITLFNSNDEKADEKDEECSTEKIAVKTDGDRTKRDLSTTPNQAQSSRLVSNERDGPTGDTTLSALVPQTPIPQTPTSAMLYAERNFRRGSRLDLENSPRSYQVRKVIYLWHTCAIE